MTYRKIMALVLALVTAWTVLGFCPAPVKAAGGTAVVEVRYPSTTDRQKDLSVTLQYSDSWFSESSAVYRDDLAYGSVCLSAAAFNSNLYGEDYYAKSGNVRSFLGGIGCSDVQVNEGYQREPVEASNIGIAGGWKTITGEDGRPCKLFVFAVRGGRYDKEMELNLRIGGTAGTAHLGFQQARDTLIAWMLPYLKAHTESGDRVKIWMAGFSRGGAVVNLAAAWMNKWICARNNGGSVIPESAAGGWNADYSVYGAQYDPVTMTNTEKVAFPPSWIEGSVHFANEDLYAYTVNAPQAAAKADADQYADILQGIHNLFNPDDWFAQFALSSWGFVRYGYQWDHDVTGTFYGESYSVPDFQPYYRNLLFTVTDDTGAYNAIYVNQSLKGKQGLYFDELMGFVLQTTGLNNDRQRYAEQYQDAFEYILGRFMERVSADSKTVEEALMSSILPAIRENFLDGIRGRSESEEYELVYRIFRMTFDECGISYDENTLRQALQSVAPLFAQSARTDLEQYKSSHQLTVAHNISRIVEAHMPETALAWWNPDGQGTAGRFADVRTDDWFFEDVEYVAAHGIMTGMTGTLFGPAVDTSRAMIVTMLYRMEGEPETGSSAFADVQPGSWYDRPVAWAQKNGIVTGYSAKRFGPADAVTREQMAAILYRYAVYKGYDTGARGNLAAYADAADISNWAETALSWANGAGSITGMDASRINPKGTASRAQVAAIFHRFLENFLSDKA